MFVLLCEWNCGLKMMENKIQRCKSKSVLYIELEWVSYKSRMILYIWLQVPSSFTFAAVNYRHDSELRMPRANLGTTTSPLLSSQDLFTPTTQILSFSNLQIHNLNPQSKWATKKSPQQQNQGPHTAPVTSLHRQICVCFISTMVQDSFISC